MFFGSKWHTLFKSNDRNGGVDMAKVVKRIALFVLAAILLVIIGFGCLYCTRIMTVSSI